MVSSFIVFFSKILVGVFLFLSQIVIARFLGAEGLGVFNLFLAVNGMVLLLGSLGLGTASIYLSNKAKKDFSQLFSNSLIFGVVWGLLLSFLTFLLFLLFPSVFKGLSFKYLIVALATIPLVIIYNYCLPLLLAKFRIIAWSVFSVLYALFIFLISFIFVVLLKLGTDGAIYAVFITVLTNLFLAVLYLMKFYKISWRFDLPLFLDQIKFGASAYLGDIFSTINFKLNVFVVNIFLGVLNVAYYSVSYNIAALIFIIPYSLQQVLYSAWSSTPEIEVDQKTPRVARQALVFSIVSAFLLAFIGRFFIIFFYGRSFLPSIMPFYLILPGGVFAAFAGIFFNNFFAKGKPYITSAILVASLFLNILLSIIFIPKIGVSGASLSASISYFFSSIVALIIFCKMTKQSLKDVIFIKKSDIISIYERFFGLFTSVGKILNEISSKDIEGLKEYYEKKADEYDIIGETFESGRPFKKILYATRVKKIMEMLDIKPSDAVLEIGCGEGYYTNKILEKTGNVVASDISGKFLEKAKKNTKNKARDYVVCPAEKIPFPDNSFDKILMSEVIEHLLDWKDGAKETLRVLKPGGSVIISTPSKLSYLNIVCHVKIILRNEPLDGDHIREFSRRELAKLLEEYFEIESYGYANYFPIIIPPFVANFFGIDNIERAIFTIENILSHIFFIKEQGLVFFIKVKKKL
jgi:O-antigen/teichoic acid export membrane protein/ubiquinone/menaquinone biosynthesis C-methylase UbiE